MEEVKEDINEFENIEVPNNDDAPPAQAVSDVPAGEDLISDDSGQVYDFTKAPKTGKAPPRIDLNGKELTLLKAEIKLPDKSAPWDLSKAGTSQYKSCQFSLFYDHEGQQEYLSGMRVFKRDDNGYSHPSITRDRNNQASKLFGLYADYKKKHINEVSLYDFMTFLNSKPKVRIVTEDFNNPQTNKSVKKNMIGAFI